MALGEIRDRDGDERRGYDCMVWYCIVYTYTIPVAIHYSLVLERMMG